MCHQCFRKEVHYLRPKQASRTNSRNIIVRNKLRDSFFSQSRFIAYADRAIMVHKFLREKFTKRIQISKYETRRTDNLPIYRARLEISKMKLSYVGAKVWNEIPNHLGNDESTHLLKQKK